MARVHSTWFHLAAQGSVAVALAFPLVGVPAFAASVFLYKRTKRIEDDERATARTEQRGDFLRKFHARQRYDSYEHYLASDEWSDKRGAVLRRAGGRCETVGCFAAATEVHHKWYPKVWGTEQLDSLVAICRQHHDAEHPDKA